jgi:DNA-directed RNA polymerase subunit M/transcription elongation factor TFIIS
MSRAQVLRSLRAFLPPLQAHALEHACYAQALATRTSYERGALRCLYLLEQGIFTAESLLRDGALKAACAPTEVFVLQQPKQLEILARNQKKRDGEALLKDLIQGDATEALPDTGLRCKKCGSNDISHEFLQTRSADEGTTIFCFCTRCKKRWKM